MFEYIDERDPVYRIAQVSPSEEESPQQRAERERQIVEELYAIFEKQDGKNPRDG